MRMFYVLCLQTHHQRGRVGDRQLRWKTLDTRIRASYLAAQFQLRLDRHSDSEGPAISRAPAAGTGGKQMQLQRTSLCSPQLFRLSRVLQGRA